MEIWHLWPAAVYGKHGEYLGAIRVAAVLPTLVADDGRVFLRKARVDGVWRFHEADPMVPSERAIVVETYRQMDAAGL